MSNQTLPHMDKAMQTETWCRWCLTVTSIKEKKTLIFSYFYLYGEAMWGGGGGSNSYSLPVVDKFF